MNNGFDNLDSFPLTINSQKPIILDLILICIGCRPNSACNIYIGVFFIKLTICQRNSCKLSIIWLFQSPISHNRIMLLVRLHDQINVIVDQLGYSDYEFAYIIHALPF